MKKDSKKLRVLVYCAVAFMVAMALWYLYKAVVVLWQ